jgi:hypothetical protein
MSLQSFRDLRQQDYYRTGEPPLGFKRSVAFPSEMRAKQTTVDGRKVIEVVGYATTYNRGYKMWDSAGSYTEIIDPYALTRSLSGRPDVAFLVNHTGVTMARTRTGSGRTPTLTLNSDSTGLNIQAWLNPERSDVHDLMVAIDDGDIDEMSFAFRIEDFQWDADYTVNRLTQLDINRGDVSAVNFGANPNTMILSAANDFQRLLDRYPYEQCKQPSRILAERIRELESITGTSYVARSGFNVDTSAWNASKMWASGAASDNPGAFYKACCAGRKEGNPHNQASWALPYRYTPSSGPNAAGVRNALARINQTDGLTNKAEAQSLLEDLMKKVKASDAVSGSTVAASAKHPARSLAAALVDYELEAGGPPPKQKMTADIARYMDRMGYLR